RRARPHHPGRRPDQLGADVPGLTGGGRFASAGGEDLLPGRTDQDAGGQGRHHADDLRVGADGRQILTTGSLSDFFDKVRTWYGNDPTLLAPNDPNAPHFTSNSLGFFGLLSDPNPIPLLPTFDQ